MKHARIPLQLKLGLLLYMFLIRALFTLVQSTTKYTLIQDALSYIKIHLHISFAYATIISALY